MKLAFQSHLHGPVPTLRSIDEVPWNTLDAGLRHACYSCLSLVTNRMLLVTWKDVVLIVI